MDLEQAPVAALSMRLNRDALPDLVLLQPGSVAPLVAITQVQATITVDTTLDNAAAGDNRCTLREAIHNANSNSDTTLGDCAAGTGADAIGFNIGGGGSTATIALASGLPSITDPVTIDGTTQGCAGPPCVALDGSGTPPGVNGLTLTAGSNSIRGLVIHEAGQHGILATSSDNFIEGNFIGTDLSGTAVHGNTNTGIRLESGASSNVVGGSTAAARNVISGNGGSGIYVLTLSNDNQVLGNFIGTDATGTVDLGNDSVGVQVNGSADNRIGGASVGAGNVISGNAVDGVFIAGVNSQGNHVLGNFIGTDVSGAIDLGNTLAGVEADGSSNTTIGGASSGARNVISGNDDAGVLLDDSSLNSVLGNYIGTDADGTADLGNAKVGVFIFNAPNNTVGGAAAGTGNVISGNDTWGVAVFRPNSTDNVVLGNRIGTDRTGTAAIANAMDGVLVQDAADNTIGGTVAGAGNVISGNDRTDGIYILDRGAPVERSQVQGNFIGTDANGTAALGNGLDGIFIEQAPTNTIGGTLPGARNIISGNADEGLNIFGSDATGNQVQGNFIGTDVTGTVALPNVDDGVLIDGAPGNTIGGAVAGARNVVSGNGDDGVELVGAAATSNLVQGNYIGTDVTGMLPLGNGRLESGDGVVIRFSASSNLVGGPAGARNVISANSARGVLIFDGASGNSVENNYIGTDVTGSAALGNEIEGVVIAVAQNNTIGGTVAGAGNVVSGNADDGVRIFGVASTGNQLQGNFIGTDATGTVAVPNVDDGVYIEDAPNNTIGGTTPGARNVISGNGDEGVQLSLASATGNLVQGNYIGTDVTGILALGNGTVDQFGDGVLITSSASANIIGGPSGAGNVISSNGARGVAILTGASGNTVAGNSIGTDSGGTFALGNVLHGVAVDGGFGNTVGGTTSGAGNRISNNGQSGVRVSLAGGVDNAILQNSILSNAALGIALADNTVFVNDPGDADSGPNRFQNYPVLTSVTVGATDTTVEGTLNSLSNTTFRLEFFANTACDASLHGEGESFLGTANVTTNGSGNASFTETFPNTTPVSTLITATATDPSGNTSEFSVCGTDTDSDGDTVSDTDDCDDGDSQVWTTPGEVLGLTLTHSGGLGGTTTLGWTAPTPLGGATAAVVYDTISSADPDDFVTSATCVETDDATDTMSTDSTDPASGTVLFYLIRAETSCGASPLGTDSSDTPRSARGCP